MKTYEPEHQKTYCRTCVAIDPNQPVLFDQSLHCLHEETLHVWLSKIHSVKILIRLCKCAGPEVNKLFSCSTQLSMKFSLLINIKMPTTVGIFIFISRVLCSARNNLQLLVIWDLLAGQIPCSSELNMKKVL